MDTMTEAGIAAWKQPYPHTVNSSAVGQIVSPTVSSALSDLTEIQKRLSEIIVRSTRVAETLSPLGPVPTSAGAEEKEPNGMVSVLSARLSSANRQISVIEQTLTRVESALGI